MNNLPSELVTLISYHLEYYDICSLLCVCKNTQINVNWKDYFFSKIDKTFHKYYENFIIDKRFMKYEGKELINQNENIHKQYTTFIPIINSWNISRIYNNATLPSIDNFIYFIETEDIYTYTGTCLDILPNNEFRLLKIIENQNIINRHKSTSFHKLAKKIILNNCVKQIIVVKDGRRLYDIQL